MALLQSASDLARNLFASFQKQAAPAEKAISSAVGNAGNAVNNVVKQVSPVVQNAIHNAATQVTNTQISPIPLVPTYHQSIGQVGNFGMQNIVRPVARAGAVVGTTLGGIQNGNINTQKPLQPKPGFMQTFLGTEPVKNLPQLISQNTQGLQKIGINKNVATPLAGIGTVAGIGLDATPLGLPEKGGAKVALKAGETAVQDIAKTGGKVIGSIGNKGEQVLGDLAKTEQITNPKNPYFNVNRINVSAPQKQVIKQTVEEIKPQIEKVVGKTLSNKEVIQQANGTAKFLNNAVDRTKTAAYETSLLQTRQKLADLAKKGTVDQEYIDTLTTLKSHATDIARKLQSFSINADSGTVSTKNMILDSVLKAQKDSSKIIEAAKGVDFNNYNQATEFYRKFVKPTAGEWADALRYNSMLSSPNTHINNATSNLLNTGVVAPLEKGITGTIDFLHSSVTGKPRTAFAGEAPAYLKGYASSLGDASHKFADVMRGNREITNLDTKYMPIATSGVKGAIAKTLEVPTNLLEASDQFFTSLTKGGESAALNLRKAKGVAVGNIEQQSAKNAAYRLFRSDIGGKDQGYLLRGIDEITGVIQRLRTSDNPLTSTIAKYTLPFVRTPMNILKQGIEYSPAGVATIPGATNKTEQISKAILGSTAAAATAMLTASGRTTWATPTDPKEKQAFLAAGMQPYSVKIGDKWVAYDKLPPAMSFPMALVSSIHDAQQKGSLTDTSANAILSGVAQWGNFFADQSYVKNIGDLIASAKQDPEKIAEYWANYPQQLIPFRALSGWIARTLDPYQRKVDPGQDFIQKQVQNLMLQVPGLRQQVTPRADDQGNPIPNQDRFTNAVSPAKVSTEIPQGAARFDNRQTQLQANAYIKPLKTTITNQVDSITGNVSNRIFNGILAKNPNLSPLAQDQIKKRLDSLIRTRVKTAVGKTKQQDILNLIKNIPTKDHQQRIIYLQAIKSAGIY